MFISFGRRGTVELLKDWSVKINCWSSLLSLPWFRKALGSGFCPYFIPLTESDPLRELLLLSSLCALHTTSSLLGHPLFLALFEIKFSLLL